MLTRDSLFAGKLTVHQYRDGYRFSLDAVLLAGLSCIGREERVADLGTGCGVIPLILAHRRQGRELVGLEIQPDLAHLAQKNVELNGFDQCITILETDFRNVADHFPVEHFDTVISNPPYRRLQTGRINPARQRALARHEIAGSAADVYKAGKHLLRHGGRLLTIYPAARLTHLMCLAQEHGFSPKRLIVIHSHARSPARLVFLECRKGGGEELNIESPFCIYQANGEYTPAMQQLYEG